MGRVVHEAKKTFWHLAAAQRVPSDYEVKSTLLGYGSARGFEVEMPLGAWYTRYRTHSRLTIAGDDAFADPSQTTYTSYVTQQRDAEIYLDKVLEQDAPGALFRSSNAGALENLYRDAVGPLRFLCHGLQMLAAYVAHLAPSSRITIASAFQAADELRRVQRFAYRIRQIELAGVPVAEASRAAWQNSTAWQPMRRLVETLFVTYDFGEALIALNLGLKPAVDCAYFPRLALVARRLGDNALAELVRALQEDGARHALWVRALIEAGIRTLPDARSQIVQLLEPWRNRAREALSALDPLLDAAGSEPLSNTFDRHAEALDGHFGLARKTPA